MSNLEKKLDDLTRRVQTLEDELAIHRLLVRYGYSRVYLRKGNGIEVFRVSFNRFELARDHGQWQIADRTTRLLGHEEAKKIFAAALG